MYIATVADSLKIDRFRLNLAACPRMDWSWIFHIRTKLVLVSFQLQLIIGMTDRDPKCSRSNVWIAISQEWFDRLTSNGQPLIDEIW